MGELDNHRSLSHLVVNLSVHGGSEQGQQRAHAFTSCEQQVA